MGAGSSVAGARSTAPSLVRVGERDFIVHVGAPGEPLSVETASGERARLWPWRLGDHLDALDRYVDAGGGAVHFDHEGFAREVLLKSGAPASLAEELEPLALWWAVGGETGEPGEVKEGKFCAHKLRARLRRWTFAEREGALSASVVARADGAKEFRLARYLRAMLRASVVELDPAPLEDLEGAEAAALLNAVSALNAEGKSDTDKVIREGGDGGKVMAATTLRICRALGWTPSQVWAAPAAEIDRIIALLDLVEPQAAARAGAGEPKSQARRPSLADYPDAVIIRVEDG